MCPSCNARFAIGVSQYVEGNYSLLLLADTIGKGVYPPPEPWTQDGDVLFDNEMERAIYLTLVHTNIVG